ncbi:CLUMA_CG003185, isoform A [Clunio marinus]|uniref:CLUMA_CG003185, isoform A n=1 Tax=Clunio marinus TaxID=568069 RepID=A0A1J1HN09_9DIPT|nr:CLUMA_CG003185, isoform A [Clunio marinus]
MPFVQRQIEPKYIARRSSASKKSTSGSSPLRDNELETITNLTLSNAMRQLASLLALSKEIFTELNKELEGISERSTRLKTKINTLQNKVDDPSYDAKLVVVPESDLVTFVQIKNHFKTDYVITTNLFTVESRTDTLQKMYENAAKTPVPAIEEMDKILGHRDRRSSDAFICTPILGQVRRRMKNSIDIEIETNMPAAVKELRKWTSNEAIGDITVAPDCVARVGHNTSMAEQSLVSNRAGTSFDCTDDVTVISVNNNNSRRSEDDKDEPLDHRLPSPEEQCLILALKYPAQIVRVDTSGKRFDRQSAARKSLLHVQTGLHATEDANDSSNTDSVKRRSRSRKPRGNRRNTIAGTDQKEIEGISDNGHADEGEMLACHESEVTIVPRSKSSDVLKKDSLAIEVKRSSSHFNSLKQWGKSRLRMINRLSGTSDDTTRSSFRHKPNSDDIDDFNVLEAINKRQKKINDKDRRLSHERKPSYSSSERSLTVSSGLPTTTKMQTEINGSTLLPVKMREPTVLRRHRRGGFGNKDEPHSSSGNWSASSESGRTSIGSEITTTTTHPKSSASSSSLNHNNHTTSSGPPSSIISRRRFLNTSASSSITSEGTATPELQMFDGLHDEGETSSVYSCDTEGYYTSFHVDSGLKTLKEEEPITPMHSSMALSSTNSFESSGNQTVISPENEYELFGKGSTTTSSSAGTVCTAVLSHYENDRMGPSVPERKSSLGKLNRSGSSTSSSTLVRSCSTSTVGSTLEKGATIKRNGVLLQKEVSALVHQHKQENIISRGESPDSGNNTSSSPIDSNSSPTNQNTHTYSEFECSESSDLECVERTERIRIKTNINTSRIPSMCVITPSPSDDESKPTMKDEKIKIKENFLNLDKDTGYATVMQSETKISRKTSPLLPLNSMLGKLKGVLHPLKKSPNKEIASLKNDLQDDYVTIADIHTPKKTSSTSNGVYYSSDILKRNLATVLSGNLNEETEYVSLNELPCNVRTDGHLLAISANEKDEKIDKDKKNGGSENRGAVVKLDAHGKPIFDSNSLKRKKGAITTFSPGPCVKDTTESITTTTTVVSGSQSSTKNISENHNIKDNSSLKSEAQEGKSSAGIYRRPVNNIRPVVSQRNLKSSEVANENKKQLELKTNAVENSKTDTNSMSTTNNISQISRPNGSVALNLNSISSKTSANGAVRGAYVNIQDSAPLRNGPPIYSPPSPSSAVNVFAQQQQLEDYQRFYRDNEMMSSSFNSAYQWSPEENDFDGSALKRGNNNIYWTLQTRSKTGHHQYSNDNAYQIRDDVSQETRSKDIESLYSTPNKNRKNQLRTTPLGFEFFSPVAPSKLNERIIEEEKEIDSKDIMSPIDPRNNGVFSTSTPQRNPNFSTMSPSKTSLTEDLRSRLRLQNPGIRSHGNSPISSGRSTPKCVFEPQQQSRSRHSWSTNNVEIPSTSTCSDRLGTPKTSLMDFKKLLLNKNTSTRSGKISAVELLKQSKTNAQKSPSPTPGSLNNSMNILDLSSSPKTFATRRMIRQGQFGSNLLTNSPSKTNNKQKHTWRMQNIRTDVISTSIPEAANDEEQESATSNNNQQRNLIEMKKSPEIVIKDVTEVEAEVEQEKALEASKVTSFKENLFIKQQENNFTENEIREHMKAATMNMQQQRAQFLFGVNSPTTLNASNIATLNNNNNNKTVNLKSGIIPPPKETSPKPSNSNATASLETAL